MGHPDYQTAAICVLILIWCFYEYQKREKLHKLKIEYLRLHHELPVAHVPVPVLPLWTTGAVLVILIGALAVIVVLALKDNSKYSSGYLFVIVPFAILLAALGYAFISSLNSWRGRKGK